MAIVINQQQFDMIFANFDKDGSGKIDRGEVLNAIIGCGFGNNDEERNEIVKTIMSQADADKSNDITKEEFVNGLAALNINISN